MWARGALGREVGLLCLSTPAKASREREGSYRHGTARAESSQSRGLPLPQGQESTSKLGPVVRVRLLINHVPGGWESLLGSGGGHVSPSPVLGHRQLPGACAELPGRLGHGQGSCCPSPPWGCPDTSPDGGWLLPLPLLPSTGVSRSSQRGKQGRGALACLAPVPPPWGAGDGLTPICSWWEPHCSSTVYCIRRTLSSNELSGRPSADLIPTLARLCACAALAGRLAGQDPGSTHLGQILPAGRCLPALAGQDWPLSAQETQLVAKGSCSPGDACLPS